MGALKGTGDQGLSVPHSASRAGYGPESKEFNTEAQRGSESHRRCRAPTRGRREASRAGSLSRWGAAQLRRGRKCGARKPRLRCERAGSTGKPEEEVEQWGRPARLSPRRQTG